MLAGFNMQIQFLTLQWRVRVCEIRSWGTYIECEEWGKVLPKVGKSLRGMIGSLCANKNEVVSCILCCFNGMIGAFWKNKNEVEKSWEGWHVRENKISKFTDLNISYFAKCMGTKVCMEIASFGPFKESSEWHVWWKCNILDHLEENV